MDQQFCTDMAKALDAEASANTGAVRTAKALQAKAYRDRATRSFDAVLSTGSRSAIVTAVVAGLVAALVAIWPAGTSPTPPPVTTFPATTIAPTTTSSTAPYGVTAGVVVGAQGTLTDRAIGATEVLRTSTLPSSGSQTIAGVTYRVVSGIRFTSAGGVLYVDTPTIFQNVATVMTVASFNTSAAVQVVAGVPVVLDHWSHDGGPAHVSGVVSTASVTVTQSYLTRFGNGGVEVENTDGTANLTVTDTQLVEVPGWTAGDHVDGIQFGGGHNVTVEHVACTMANWRDTAQSEGSNSCASVWAEFGNVTGDVLIDGSDMIGGSSTLYVQAKSPWTFQGKVAVTGNRLGRGIYRTLYPGGIPSQIVWSGNVTPTGAALSLTGAQV